MTTQITHGTVKYGRTIKTGDFENKRGDVELGFTIPEGEATHETLEHVKSVARHHLHTLLNDHAKPEEEKGVIAKAPVKAPKVPVKKTAEISSEEAFDKPFKKDVEPAQELNDFTGAPEEDLSDLFDQVAAAVPVKEITDKELQEAAQKTANATRNSPGIRKALDKVGVKQPPGRIIDVPQEKRQEFLDLLAELKPLA